MVGPTPSLLIRQFSPSYLHSTVYPGHQRKSGGAPRLDWPKRVPQPVLLQWRPQQNTSARLRPAAHGRSPYAAVAHSPQPASRPACALPRLALAARASHRAGRLPRSRARWNCSSPFAHTGKPYACAPPSCSSQQVLRAPACLLLGARSILQKLQLINNRICNWFL
jgi:hypothetical protein